MKDRIRTARKAAGLTQAELAEKIGSSKGAITYYEGGQRTPLTPIAISIAKACGVNENWLITGDGEMFAPKSRADEIAEITAALTKDRDPRKIYFAKLAAELTEEQLEMLNTMALGFLDAVDKNKKSTQL